MSTPYEPPHALRFADRLRGEMLLNYDDGWPYYRHPDGQWVSLRKATEEDLRRLGKAVADADHGRG